MVNDWNKQIIEEFRSNDGKVGGNFDGHLLVLLHHKGAKTGTERVSPLAAQELADGGWAVFGSKGGAPDNPDWYYNVLANPEVHIEVGADKVGVRARRAEGEERERIWTKQKQVMPGFAHYETQTKREIPVIVLEPA